MTRGEFYYDWCVRRTFCGPLSWTQSLQLLLGFVLGAVSLQWPNWGGSLNPLLWAIPLVVFISTSAVVWVLAPYAMYRELEMSHEASRSQANTQEDVRSAYMALDELIVRCRTIATLANAQSLVSDTKAWLVANKGQSYAMKFDELMEHLLQEEIYAPGARPAMARKEFLSDAVEFLEGFLDMPKF